ncbi:MAG TPA: hypothetical protein ENH55_16600 [Aurantimonas coralicida]|uniref:Uncharacterized protein n=1 Tax=Aurantimonas coralicida TaxID=182270 RepID=A0A9C9TGI8_9HYPH|nr:hypothetical protein [Aurantimonas coralicida]HEU00525.1 hypothetical protein [Aurantimonas coralicida]
MSRPPERTLGETELRAPRRRHHSNPASDTQDPPRASDALVRAADRALEAACHFIDGDLDYGALRLLAQRYRAEVERAGLATARAGVGQGGRRNEKKSHFVQSDPSED